MSITLEYELGQADLEAFFAHHAAHAPYIVARNRRMRRIWSGAFALLAFAYSFESLVAAVGFLTLSLVYYLFYGRLNRWWYVRHNLRINASPDGPSLGTTKLSVEKEHLRIEAPEGSTTLNFGGIRRIDESDSYYFIYSGPVSASIVPKSASQAGDLIQALRAAMNDA